MVERFPDRNIDEKNRLFLPAKYTEPGIPYTFERCLMYVSPDPERVGRKEFPYLFISPIDTEDLIPDEEMDVDDLGARHSHEEKRGVGGDVRTDKSGRLLIEEYELIHCGIDTERTGRNVFLKAYSGGHFELWSQEFRERYDDVLKARLRLNHEGDSDRRVQRDLRELASEPSGPEGTDE
jgi:DNA-binding transcriptional regulator/RsmH inhibitor MraZ